MKASEIRELSVEEINEKIAESQLSLNKMKLNHSVSTLESPIVIRDTRKAIARLKTELRSRELANK